MTSTVQTFIQREFVSRRSPVLGLRGMVASSQPLASEAGMRILQAGGNAADAAVAVAAALNVTEPCSTGIGGDAFALFFDNTTKTVKAAVGAGRSGAHLTLEVVRQRGVRGTGLPVDSGLTVTVPGAPALWEDVVLHWGRLPLQQVLAPAIQLADGGFPVGPVTAAQWSGCAGQLKGPGAHALLMPDGRPPAAGSLMRNPDLGATFRSLAEKGAHQGFYSGRIGQAIVEAVQQGGGLLTEDDLRHHTTAFPPPISTTYRGLTVYELPPPNQGLAALMAMNNLELEQELEAVGWGSVPHLHAAIESMRLAFADALQHVADPDLVAVPTQELLSKQYAATRRQTLYRPDKACTATPGFSGKTVPAPSGDRPQGGGDTVYFCVVDEEGNGCSFINSNYMGFGSGIVPDGCGFSLQNRGYNFILDPDHPNCLAPNKRPYHTIIPALAVDKDGELVATFGVMGAMMQPQGHLQVLSNIVDFKMDPQAALDAPRWCIVGPDSFLGPSSAEHSRVLLEEGYDEDVVEQLTRKGHKVQIADRSMRGIFGRGQVIMRNAKTGVLWGGSDPRADGQALAW